MVNRRNREFADADIQKIAETYHTWKFRGEPLCSPGRVDTQVFPYEDIKGFCKSATLDDIRKHNYVLTPGRYVGIPDEEDDGIPFEERMAALTTELKSQMQESEVLDREMTIQLAKIGIEL